MSDSKSGACGGCSACPTSEYERRSDRLVRLGVQAEGYDYVVALAGNPNTGKSTVFNALTGLRQHTGNWPGKTVTRAEGGFVYSERQYKLVDLPGTYSLLATSADEEVARDFLLFGRPDVTIIVVDATRLERNLNLVLQVLEVTDRAVVCLNLVDEARRHEITIDHERLAAELGVPVVPASARFGRGINELLEKVHQVATGEIACHPLRVGGESPTMHQAIAQLRERLEAVFPTLPNAQWVSLRLMDADARVSQAVRSGELGELYEPRPVEASAAASAAVGDETTAGRAAPAGVATLDRDPSAAAPRPAEGAPSHGENLGGRDAEEPNGAAEAILSLASRLRWEVGPNFHQALVEAIYTAAARLADGCTQRGEGRRWARIERRLDWLLTSPWTGIPVMVLMLMFVLWLTVIGANYPSALLSDLLLGQIHPLLKSGAAAIHMPWWLDGLLIDGMYLATAWVVAVMLPPMAIFFPLFTLLEDFGYLPRVAFNLDGVFQRCGAHGKQALTMSMGFGCNAAGVIATRIIDSPRERLIAIITNNFSLCNGRWPTQILIATIFIAAVAPPNWHGVVATLAVVSVALLGIGFMFLVSWALSRTVLRGEPSSFSLEMPPYRPPRLWQTLYTSLIDRTIFVLWRAIVFALPAGAAIWLVANVPVGNVSLAQWLIGFLNPLGVLIGLNGVILLAYVVAIPANEIVIPTVLMLTVLTLGASGVGQERGVLLDRSASETHELLVQGGWTLLTGINLMLFSLLHNPCSTTIYTIWKESRSAKWALVATLIPLAMGFAVCFFVAQIWRLVFPGA